VAVSNLVIIEVETAIRRVSWATAQVGQKSLQRLTLDLSKKTVRSEFLTGTTKLVCLELGSIRDSFTLSTPRFNAAGTAFFSVSGETASAVRVMPNINYGFTFEVSASEVTFSGAHDGYPSYNISVDGKSIYDYVQGYLWQLAGSADIEVKKRTVKYK
jgi:hypothetical protein